MGNPLHVKASVDKVHHVIGLSAGFSLLFCGKGALSCGQNILIICQKHIIMSSVDMDIFIAFNYNALHF